MRQRISGYSQLLPFLYFSCFQMSQTCYVREAATRNRMLDSLLGFSIICHSCSRLENKKINSQFSIISVRDIKYISFLASYKKLSRWQLKEKYHKFGFLIATNWVSDVFLYPCKINIMFPVILFMALLHWLYRLSSVSRACASQVLMTR